MIGSCSECRYFDVAEAYDEDIKPVRSTIAYLCRKSPDVERTWAAVLDEICLQVKASIESHGFCRKYEDMVAGAFEPDECDGFAEG